MGESGKYSLIHLDLGDLSKPANTLIKKISSAIGGLSKPFQIRRVAQAEADADKIQAAARIEITELEHRAMSRLFAEEAKKQQNIEAITLKALPDLRPDAQTERVEDDWIANFFDKCRLISDEQMQSLWARILAGEANSPGKFSKRTVNLVGSLDKLDATLLHPQALALKTPSMGSMHYEKAPPLQKVAAVMGAASGPLRCAGASLRYDGA